MHTEDEKKKKCQRLSCQKVTQKYPTYAPFPCRIITAITTTAANDATTHFFNCIHRNGNILFLNNNNN
ncbi:hypothetical protein Glove_109g232 [Diversispora epigaea]|uniref:Uncharacterized protein n=1 Tax=Diversispora epigaea TaxID=1348612 RepID=A0A397J260_9GLOM|nr:hypothetical protein Glove_109g232 [Diversispora epigaea]